MAVPNATDVDLEARFAGRLIRPDEAGYDEARKVWNGMIDRRPALIAQCAGADDVGSCVRFARRKNLVVSIRGGGHNVAGTAVCDGGLMIDLRRMKGIRIDPSRRTARAEAGVLWGELDQACQTVGLATTAGIVTHTGIAGLTVGGGIGHLMRKHGLTCDNLLSVDLVTVDGKLVHASEDEEPELFWAVRGGGSNFGIVTSFEYRLHQVGPTVMAGLVMHRAERAVEVLRFYRDFAGQAPRELGSVVSLRTAPALAWVPEDLRGRPVVAIPVCYAGPIAEAERVLEPLRGFGPPAADLITPKPYLEHQAMFDVTVPHGWHYYWKSVSLPRLIDDTIDTLADTAWSKQSPRSYMILFHKGGAVRDLSDDAMAYTGRDAEHELNINGAWTAEDPENDDTAWVRKSFERMLPHSTGGVYVNFLGDEGEDRVRAAYGHAKYERLVQLKRRFDPGNFFRLNQNIEPSGDPR
ncbi:MAG TPA: FAD-binding oxidoreductase [Candidatus Limnocylindrales bacterium]|nr:FAD-binding oxidoreductase [Candidatus Limnocylindrales bacterium]